MEFESIQSGLAKYDKYKDAKTKEDFAMADTLARIQNSNGWTAIPNRLLFDLGISPQAKTLWAVLQNLGDESGHSSYGQKKLAFFCGRSCTKTVQRYNAELISRGWLKTGKDKIYPSNDSGVIWPIDIKNPKLKSMEDKYNDPK